jgi:7-carboxy-7-deazaguanine synthase
MSYAVKEMFLTLQGEGVQAGRRAVFVRFAGCNLWSGREEDRATAVCRFCDTDFVGVDGVGGGRFTDADLLADAAERFWGEGRALRYIVLTGGEPMLQIDDALIAALHARGFEIGVESNGTIAARPGIDWLCISPKAGSQVIQTSGNELKLLIQPMDCADAAGARDAAIAFVMARPHWRLATQAHKVLGLR